MRKTDQIKLYRSRKNKYLHQTINLAGRAYNHAIALPKRYDQLTGKHLHPYALMKHFTRLKKLAKWAWLKAIPSQALQAGIKTALPGFRKVAKFKSDTLKQAGWSWVSEHRLRIGNHIYRLVNDRLPQGKIKTVTMKRDQLGDLYACFSVEIDLPEPESMSGKIAGFDFGLKDFLTVYEGQATYRSQSPLFFKQSMDRIAKLNRALSRKKRGAGNRKRAKYHLAREPKRIADKRRDWFFKLAHQLTAPYDVLAFEDLNLKGMVKMWGRKVSDLAFAEFLTILQDVARLKGCVIHFVDRFYPSTKTCHHCGRIKADLPLSDRFWRCPCGRSNDRDANASMNIRREGIRALGLAAVRPPFVGQSVLEAAEPHAL
jgi:putative transposase